MYKLADLDAEIEAKIKYLEEAFCDQDLEANWIAHSILADHPLAATADPVGFHTTCTAKTVREQVRRFVQKYDGTPATTPERNLVLPGFERVQTHYLIDRGGAQTLVRIDRITDAECEAKAVELNIMGDGCYQHADELRRYMRKRRRTDRLKLA